MNVIQCPPRLRGHDFCICSDMAFGNVWQAWTTVNVDEALKAREFLAPMVEQVRAGDTVELFEIAPKHLDAPETDPLSMASVIIREIEADRRGRHVRFERLGPTLHFASSTGLEPNIGQWNGKWRGYLDGKRVASFNTRLEAMEWLQKALAKTAAWLEAAMVAKPLSKLGEGSDGKAKCRPDDIAVSGNRKISRVVEMRTLLPISEVLEQRGNYFSMTCDRFLSSDRLSILRYNNDAFDVVLEVLPLALVDIHGGGALALYPRSKIVQTGEQPETGTKLVQRDGYWTIRQEGRTVERYTDKQRAEWRFEEMARAS